MILKKEKKIQKSTCIHYSTLMTNRQMHNDKLMGLSYINALLSDYLNAVEKKHNNYDNN